MPPEVTAGCQSRRRAAENICAERAFAAITVGGLWVLLEYGVQLGLVALLSSSTCALQIVEFFQALSYRD